MGEFREGALVQGDGLLVPVEARGEATVLADCWNLGTNESRGPAIIAHSYGQGRTLSLAAASRPITFPAGSLRFDSSWDRW